MRTAQRPTTSKWYERKEEETRISDALDQTRIANVVAVEPPMVPTTPSGTGRALLFLIGAVLAVIASWG